MKTLVRAVCLPTLAAALIAASGSATAATLGLAEAVNFALEHSPIFDTARRTLQIAELQQKNAVTKFLPSLDLNAVHGINTSSPVTSLTDPWQSQVGLSLTEHLYDNGISLLGYDKAKLERQSAELSRDRAREQLCLDVVTNFYQYSSNQQIRDVKEQQLRNLEKQFNSVSDQYQQGFKTRADFLRLKSQVQRARLDLIDAETSLASSAVQLRQVLGAAKEDVERIDFKPEDPDRLPSSVPAHSLTPEQTWDVRLAHLQQRTSQIDVRVTKRSYWPQLDLSSQSNYTYSNYLGGGANGVSGNGQFTFNLLLTLNYNILDWGLRRHNVEIAEAQRDIQSNSLQQAVITASAQLETLRITFDQLKSEYRLARDLLNLAQENFNLIRQNYQEGKAQYLDLITSLNDLLFAKTSFLSVAYGLAQNIAKYRFYEGTLYATLAHR